MYTFITMRALASSPLMVGGDLVSMDKFSMSLVTNKEMIAFNQNAVMGKLCYDKDKIEVWHTAKKNSKEGWVEVFPYDLKNLIIDRYTL